jgi:hypothetical protein
MAIMTSLQVETRAFKGPRAYDATGLPLHQDNQSVIKERLFLDKDDPTTIYITKSPCTTMH